MMILFSSITNCVDFVQVDTETAT